MGHYLYTPGCAFGRCCNMPASQVAALGYVMGGSTTSSAASQIKRVQEYEPGGDAWSDMTDLPAPVRGRASAATLSSLVYCMGGQGGGVSTSIADNDEYNPSLNSWTSRTDISTAKHNASLVNIGASLYHAVGDDGTSMLRGTDRYSVDSWTAKTDAPTPARSTRSTTTIGSGMYLFCGQLAVGNTAQTDEYIPDTWTTKTAYSTATSDGTAATRDDVAYLLAGANGGRRKTNDSYVVDTWTSKTDMPTPARNALAAFTVADAVHVVAGIDSVGRITDVDSYTPDTWSSVSGVDTGTGGMAGAAA